MDIQGRQAGLPKADKDLYRSSCRKGYGDSRMRVADQPKGRIRSAAFLMNS